MKQTSELDPQKKIELGPDGNYYLVGSKCSNCGTVSFLERMVCPACASYAGHEKVLIGRSGKINNFTVAHVAPTGYQPPYIVGLIDLAEGPMIFATIDGDPAVAAKLKIGDEVRLAVVETGDPKAENFLRWKYVPVNR
ncbi:MAG: Zn-ribbon domain-containing OB-fold protein [Negativicutes bacterium]